VPCDQQISEGDAKRLPSRDVARSDTLIIDQLLKPNQIGIITSQPIRAEVPLHEISDLTPLTFHDRSLPKVNIGDLKGDL
jgi:hypothetical protein